MSDVSLSNLVIMARTLEQMGETPAVSVSQPGKMGTSDVEVIKNEQAKANEAFVRDLVSTIRDTRGMGQVQGDLAERAFGPLLASGEPLSGRAVAEVITEAIQSLQSELEPEAGLKTLEEFAATMQSAPLSELDDTAFPEGLARVNGEQVQAFVEGHVETMPPQPSQTKHLSPACQIIDEAREELDRFFTHFGGAPLYPGGKPCYEASSRKFFGIPLESCQAWCEQRIKNSKVFKGFWQCVGKAFGLPDTPRTTFERVALYLESVKSLASHRNAIADAFGRGPDEGSKLMGTLTRLACHVRDNGGAATMITIIDNYIGMFTFQYSEAKKRGELEDFFSALDGVCFENRMSKLQEYSSAHMDEDVSPVTLQPGEFAIKPEFIPDHKLNDTMLEAFNREVGAVAGSYPDLALDWDHILYPHLLSTMLGKERQVCDDKGHALFNPDNTPKRAKITGEDITRLRAKINDAFCFDD